MKHSLLFFLFFLLSIGLSGQTTFGVKLGANLVDFGSNEENEIVTDFRPRLSFQAGAFLKRKFTEKGAFQLELIYFGKGFNFDNRIDNINEIIRLHYISLPAYYIYQASQKIGISFGVELSYLIKANIESENGTNTINDQFFEKLDLGLLFGLRFALGAPFYLDFRYTHGLLRAIDLGSIKFNNMALSSTLIYEF